MTFLRCRESKQLQVRNIYLRPFEQTIKVEPKDLGKDLMIKSLFGGRFKNTKEPPRTQRSTFGTYYDQDFTKLTGANRNTPRKYPL